MNIPSKRTYVALAVLAVVFLVSLLLLAWRAQMEKSDPIQITGPTVSAGRYVVEVRNVSERDVICKLHTMEVRYEGGGWSSWLGFHTYDSVPSITPGVTVAVPPPLVLFMPSNVHPLAPNESCSIAGDVPRHISVPMGARAWRIPVEWSSASPSKTEVLIGKLSSLIGRSYTNSVGVPHTNYSREMRF